MKPTIELALLRNRCVGYSEQHGPICSDLLMSMPVAKLHSVLEQVLIQKAVRQRVYNESKTGYNHS